MNNAARRKIISRIVEALCALAVVLALIPLAMILFYVLTRGLSALNFAFFTHTPKPVGEAGGGMANAIVGTLILIGIAALFAVPIGMICGIHLAEYAGTKFSSIVRFAADVLNGVPSIVIGMFAYGLVVLPVKRFSAIAGGVALGLLMIPIVVRTTEELLRRSRAVFGVIVPAALPGILTGILVALARVAGETAPLLFTSFNNAYWSTNLMQPMASLTYQVYTYALSPYDDWHRQAWAGAFLLVMMILTLSIAARLAVRRLERMNRP